MADNAGVFLQRVDKSQVPGSIDANAIYAAAAIHSERGFINTVYTVNKTYNREVIFGKKNWRLYGVSAHDLDIYLESNNPAYVVRAGDPAWRNSSFTGQYKAIATNLDTISASTTDDSFNDSGSGFDTSLQAGDGIYVTGFTESANNGWFTVVSATNAKIVVNENLTTEAAGDTVSISGFLIVKRVYVIETEITVSTSDVDDSYNDSNTGFSISGLSAGDLIYVSGFTTAANNGWKTVTGTPTTAKITVSETLVTEAAGDSVSIYNEEGLLQSELDTYTGDEVVKISAKGEGTWGNSIWIEGIAFSNDVYISGDQNRLSTINVYYPNATTLVETHIVSRSTDDYNESGAPLYFVNVLASSKFIAGFDNESNTDDFGLIFSKTQLSGGQTTNSIVAADYLVALKMITDYPETYDVVVAMNAGGEIDHADFSAAMTLNGKCLGISCSNRADGISQTLSASDFVTARAASHGGSASGEYPSNNYLCALFPQWQIALENETGQDIFISPVGFAAANIARQSNNGQLWYAPAGYRRGNAVGSKGNARNFSGSDRVTLVTAQWNPIKSDRRGVVFWDELTTQTVKTAYQNIHVTLAYNSFQRSIPITLAGFEFEFNDAETVAQIVTLLQDLADRYVEAKAAEEIIIDDDENVIGTDEIKIRWNWRPKGVARMITVSVIAYRSDTELSVSMAQVG